MGKKERDRLLRLVTNPPTGSKIAAAKAFGVDLTLTVRKLGLTPTSRLRELQTFVEKLHRARQTHA